MVMQQDASGTQAAKSGEAGVPAISARRLLLPAENAPALPLRPKPKQDRKTNDQGYCFYEAK
jgi:hypothetical protein